MDKKEFNTLVLSYIRGFEMLLHNAEVFNISGLDDMKSIYTLGKEQFLTNFDQLSEEEVIERRRAYDEAFEQFQHNHKK
ncbi:hypothetical protein [Bacillus solimangrovi]|uniref:Uncharacterized protein n=1 Tax=Bacillus solimangrovi TaxID=1305675 RepID=A0A1E5LJP9_9BACI|nr:hypothetical protein [Bacillus solimangrovi]OEH94310.1 hypothetical protein BFG57_08625 [Bacillus solimangrovi]